MVQKYKKKVKNNRLGANFSLFTLLFSLFFVPLNFVRKYFRSKK